MLPRFLHFCYFIEQKSISQTQPYPISFPVSNFFLFFSFFSFLFPFFFFYPPHSQQRGVGEGRWKDKEGWKKQKKEREREKEFLFVSVARDNILWANERKSGLVNFQREGERDPKTWNACAISKFSFWWPESTVWKGKAEGNRFHLSRTNDYQWVNDTQLAPTLVRKHTNIRTHRKLDVYPPTPTGDMYKNQ